MQDFDERFELIRRGARWYWRHERAGDVLECDPGRGHAGDEYALHDAKLHIACDRLKRRREADPERLRLRGPAVSL